MNLGRPFGGVLALALRNSLGAWRVDSPAQRFIRLGVLGVATAANCALSVLLGYTLARLQGSPGYGPLVSGIITAVAVGWIASTILFGARFTVDLPLLNLVHLPITFRRLYVARVVTGMAGPWLALFLPPLAAVAWAGSHGVAQGVLCAVAILVFVRCLTEISTILTIVLERWTSSWLATVALFVLLTAATWMYFTLAADGSRHATSAIAGMLRALGGSSAGWVSAALPTGLFVTVVSAGSVGSGLRALALLAIWWSALMAASYRLLLWRVLGHPQPSAPRAAGSRPLRLLLDWTARRPFQRAASGAALVAQALLGYARISNIRLLLLAGIPYCVAFPAFVHGSRMMAPFAYGMLWVPVMFFIAVKSNLLGADPSAVRACFWYPVAVGAPIRAKLTAINLLESGLAVLMYATIAVMSPRVATIGNTWSAIAYWVSQIALTDAFCAVSSLTAPKPMTWGRAAPSGNDAQILVASGLTGGLAVVFTIVSVITIWRRAWWLMPTSATAAMIALLIVRGLVLTRSVPRLLDDRRDRILAALPLGS